MLHKGSASVGASVGDYGCVKRLQKQEYYEQTINYLADYLYIADYLSLAKYSFLTDSRTLYTGSNLLPERKFTLINPF